MALLESEEVARFVVGGAVDPAAKEDADPLEGQGADGGVVGGALGAVAVVEGACPEGAPDGLSGPLDEGLAKELGTGPAPVDPVFVATALGETGAMPVSIWRAAALGKRSRRSPKAASSRAENTGPAPGSEAKSL